MLGNTFGRMFRVTTCGESYGGAFRQDLEIPELRGGLITIVDGVPAGIKLTSAVIDNELEKRRPGKSDLATPRKEKDKPYILSGVMEDDFTTGAPVGIYIPNSDILPDQIEKHREKRNVLRPGQATLTYHAKYGEYSDFLGAGRASGRETASRVAAGAVAKAVLDPMGIDVVAYTKALYGIESQDLTYTQVKENYRKNQINCPDPIAADKMIAEVLKAKSEGDTLGGIVEIIVKGAPIGLGEPVFDKLDALLAYGLMSIGAVKGVEIGAGFEHAKMRGSQSNDIPYIDPVTSQVRFKTNNSGGILGGISNGEEIRIRVAVKPTPTLTMPEETVDISTKENITTVFSTRNDPTICARIYSVCEAMVRMTILDALYMAKGYDAVLRMR